jgi:hypothetical protein
MKASGLNSIEYVLHLIGCAWKIISAILLVLIVGPVLYLLWSWNTMKYQNEAIQCLNGAQEVVLTVDLNRCPATLDQLIQERNVAIATAFRPSYEVINTAPLLPLPFAVRAPRLEDPLGPFVLNNLPWGPALLRDPILDPKEGFHPYGNGGNSEAIYLDHYRRSKDVPHADPWYFHGLFKLAPTKHWDDGTGPDYVFGKTAENYHAYAGAVRAVAMMRLLLGARAMGIDGMQLLPCLIGPLDGSPENMDNPVTAYNTLTALVKPGDARAFMRAYDTDWGDQLPVLDLTMQKFDDDTWKTRPGKQYSMGQDWEEHMQWWGGPFAGNGSAPDNSRDYFITGLATRHNPLGCRPQFTPTDFLLNHMPDLTPGQRAAHAELRRVTTDAFWDSLLSADLRSDAHILLNVVRLDLDHDYRFARKYGYIMFQGDKFGRSASVMK